MLLAFSNFAHMGKLQDRVDATGDAHRGTAVSTK